MLALEVEQLPVQQQTFDFHTMTSSRVPSDETFVVDYVLGEADDSTDWSVEMPSSSDDLHSPHAEASMMQYVDFAVAKAIVVVRSTAALHAMRSAQRPVKDVEVDGVAVAAAELAVVAAAADGSEVLVANEIVVLAGEELAASRPVLDSTSDYSQFDRDLCDYSLDAGPSMLLFVSSDAALHKRCRAEVSAVAALDTFADVHFVDNAAISSVATAECVGSEESSHTVAATFHSSCSAVMSKQFASALLDLADNRPLMMDADDSLKAEKHSHD